VAWQSAAAMLGFMVGVITNQSQSQNDLGSAYAGEIAAAEAVAALGFSPSSVAFPIFQFFFKIQKFLHLVIRQPLTLRWFVWV